MHVEHHKLWMMGTGESYGVHTGGGIEDSIPSLAKEPALDRTTSPAVVYIKNSHGINLKGLCGTSHDVSSATIVGQLHHRHRFYQDAEIDDVLPQYFFRTPSFRWTGVPRIPPSHPPVHE
jgi:hypothetical protein